MQHCSFLEDLMMKITLNLKMIVDCSDISLWVVENSTGIVYTQ